MERLACSNISAGITGSGFGCAFRLMVLLTISESPYAIQVPNFGEIHLGTMLLPESVPPQPRPGTTGNGGTAARARREDTSI